MRRSRSAHLWSVRLYVCPVSCLVRTFLQPEPAHLQAQDGQQSPLPNNYTQRTSTAWDSQHAFQFADQFGDTSQ